MKPGGSRGVRHEVQIIEHWENASTTYALMQYRRLPQAENST